MDPFDPFTRRETTDARSGANEANESDHFEIGIQSLVMGTDSAGRLNEEEFITWWKATKEPRWINRSRWLMGQLIRPCIRS